MDCFRTSAQNDRIARLEAESCGIDRDIRAGFIDEPDHAERNGNFVDPDSVGAGGGRENFARGIGQGDNVAESVRHRLDALRVQLETVEHGGGESLRRAVFHIDLIGGNEFFRVFFKRIRHCRKPAVLEFRRRVGNLA